MPVSFRILVLLTAAASASAEEALPLPTSLTPVLPLLETNATPVPAGFLKPTKSIRPPVSAPPAAGMTAAAPAPVQIVSAPGPDMRLRRLVVVNAAMAPEAIRDTIIASSQGRTPVTFAGGVTASAPVLSDLANLFGSTATEDTQKKVIETVRKGMGAATRPLKRVEVVGWVPSQGVMAVAVYPES
jgi:hypothetical protein